MAFDEVAGIRIKDPDTIQIMKDYMANGRFSRGTEVIASAGLSFVGNLDLSIDQVVNSPDHDLFQPMPKKFNLAVMDRFAAYIPGWEMPKTDSSILTTRFGFITDYLAEAFHHLFKHVSVFEEVNRRFRPGACVEGRDEAGVKKTLCAFLKILHPDGRASDEEFEEYVRYALECRRRVKEQMNKRKPDDEFARIALGYVGADGREHEVFCPESEHAPATLAPRRQVLGAAAGGSTAPVRTPADAGRRTPGAPPAGNAGVPERAAPLEPRDYSIRSGERGHTYANVIGPYLQGASSFVIEDPFVRMSYQVQNFTNLCELAVRTGTIRRIALRTRLDAEDEKFSASDWCARMDALRQSLLAFDIRLEIDASQNDLHDRRILVDNGWEIVLGRGLDWYAPVERFTIGSSDPELRPCRQMQIWIKRRLD